MPRRSIFSFRKYDRHSYRRSNAVKILSVAQPKHLAKLAWDLARALDTAEQAHVARASQRLIDELISQFDAPPVRVNIALVRPRKGHGELHGLYQGRSGKRELAEITVWMRTAKRHQVVAFRTFLRTLLHEFCHHFDWECLGLTRSYHTEGFYRRESSLYGQILPDASPGKRSLKHRIRAPQVS